MAYEKQTWVNGETITQEKLNHMEDGIANAGGDAGYECVETKTELFNETVTTAKTAEEAPFAQANLAYSELIDADVIFVTFDDVDYQFHKVTLADRPNVFVYGDVTEQGMPIFSEYPFAILSMDSGTRNITTLVTENAGEHTITASATVYTPENISACFMGAVGEGVSDYLAKNFTTHIHTETVQKEVSVRPDGVTGGVDLACPHTPIGIIGIDPTAKNPMGVDGEVILKEMYMTGSYGNNLHLDYLNTTSEIQTFTVCVTYTYIGAGGGR